MNYENDAEKGASVVESPYTEVMLGRIGELQNLSESILSRTNSLCGRGAATVGAAEKECKSPENFCDTAIRDLRSVDNLLREALENLGRM
jgi:hypothetical protein